MFSDRDYYRNGNPQRRSMNSYSAVTTLIYINVACHFLRLLNPAIVTLFCLNGTTPFQIWRLVTYQFFHAGFGHIFWNMYGIWLFGRLMEQVLGKKRFYILYLFSGVLGGIFFELANFGAPYTCIGASGALFGIMAAAAVTFPQAQFFLLFPPIPVRLWVFALGYCLLEVLFLLSGGNSGVAHLAHLGGALGGFLFMKRLFELSRENRSRRGASWKEFFHRENDTPPPPKPKSSPREEPPRKPYVFNQDELNRILDKMSRQGYSQLTDQEREALRQASEELKRRN